jgi:uncharacterized protein (DUF305 family)
MKTSLRTVFTVAMIVAAPMSALAQDASDAGRTLPEICTKDYADQVSMQTMGGMHPMPEQPSAMSAMDMSQSDQAHQDLMAGMADMDKNMAQGMMAKDVDVAFVCGMIPHHQGAIDMAKAELAHGDDPWVKEQAQKIVEAQTAEIAEMLAWLAKQ